MRLCLFTFQGVGVEPHRRDADLHSTRSGNASASFTPTPCTCPTAPKQIAAAPIAVTARCPFMHPCPSLAMSAPPHRATTPADVSRFAGVFEHVLETVTAGVTLQSPQVGLSVCLFVCLSISMSVCSLFTRWQRGFAKWSHAPTPGGIPEYLVARSHQDRDIVALKPTAV